MLGSLVGVGGGIIVVPALTLLFGVDIHNAIAASIVAVVATSSGAAVGYMRARITNLRLAMLLEVATALGALCGAYLAGIVSVRRLFAAQKDRTYVLLTAMVLVLLLVSFGLGKIG